MFFHGTTLAGFGTMPLLLTVLLLLVAAQAVTEDSERVKAAVITPAQSSPGAVDVAVEFRIAPGWHLYWSNPGDSGLPPKLVWTLPTGWRVDAPRFPGPQRHIDGGLTTFIHEARLVLLCTMHIPAGTAAGAYDVQVKAKWLVCQEACVPGSAELRAVVQVGGEAAGVDAATTAIAAARAALPQPLAGSGLDVTARLDASTIVLTVGGADGSVQVFPGIEGAFSLDSFDVQTQAGASRVRLPFAAGAEIPERFSGVLTIGARSFVLDLPFTSTTPSSVP